MKLENKHTHVYLLKALSNSYKTQTITQFKVQVIS